MAHVPPLVDRDVLVCIGRIHSAHGMAGQVKAVALTADPEWYVREGHLADVGLYVDGTQGLRHVRTSSLRSQPGGWLLQLAAHDSRDAAEGLIGDELLLEPERLKPLAADEYLLHDLIGCTVCSTGGEIVGTVLEVMETGANGVLWLSGPAGEELAVPMTEEVVKHVDIAARMIVIDPLPGLLELNT